MQRRQFRSLRELGGEWCAGKGNFPANTSSVELGGLRLGLLQNGYSRIRALPQLKKFRVRFFRLAFFARQ